MNVTQILKKTAKRAFVVAVAVLMLMSLGLSASASTFVPYSTYTYDFDGYAMESPHAYVASECVTDLDMGLTTALSSPSDLVTDPDGNFYIADTKNSRVVVLDSNLKYVTEFNKFYNEGAIIPYVQTALETEATEAENKLKRRLTNWSEDEDNPRTYKLTFEAFQAIEKRMAAVLNDEAALQAEYEAIVAEYTSDECIMPTFEDMDALLNYIYPVTYKYDALSQESVDAAPLGETEEERRCYAYFQRHLHTTENDPSSDNLLEPEGLFVTDDGTLFVADTGNYRVVKLERQEVDDAINFVAIETFEKPTSSILEESLEFRPMNLVVDDAGRIYVNVKNVNSGIMQLDSKGEFMGYYGAQKVSSTVWQWFMQLFQTDEQRARTVRIVPRVYNNITIDHKNFVWVTANSMENAALFNYLTTGDSGNAPIKRLNPSGDDVLVRNNIWAPGGDIPEKVTDVSSIVDVAVKGDTGIYTLVDEIRNKLFTYDSEGNLLYAFGGTGQQLGLFRLASAALYQGTDLLVLDKSTGYVTRFKQTEYATTIETALTADDNREYALAESSWKQVQKLNSNFDLAYIGLAKCYLRSAAQADPADASELYQKAMEYYRLARNTEGYSKAFKEYRSLYARNHLFLILVIAAAIFVAIYFAVRALNKVNAKLHITGSATTLKEELCYGWRVIFHPFNGFWEIKREKRGTMRSAVILLIGAVVAFCYNATGTAYLFNNVAVEEISLLQQAANVLIPVVLWVLASWAFTTLMSGEGSMGDIFIALCYGLIPLIIILVPTTLMSNIFSLDEQPFLIFFTSLAYAWMGVLVVIGSMVVQDYTFSKNLLTVVLSVLGMAAIMFIVLLLFSLTGKLYGFFETIVLEIVHRL